MRFRPTALPGVMVVEPERVEDERGHPTLAIAWPTPEPACFSARDRALPWLTECKALSASLSA